MKTPLENRRARHKRWRLKHPDKVKSNKLKIRYGVDLDQYNRILAYQNNACAICERHQSNFKRQLAVDHNHLTGKVRGLLCSTCNRVLGMLFEDVKRVDNLRKYIVTYENQ